VITDRQLHNRRFLDNEQWVRSFGWCIVLVALCVVSIDASAQLVLTTTFLLIVALLGYA